jgi:hypothetical protein
VTHQEFLAGTHLDLANLFAEDRMGKDDFMGSGLEG